MEPDNSDLLPSDPECTRHDQAAVSGGANIVHYQRRAGQAMQFAGPPASGEVIFIDENTPAPPEPPRQPHVPFSRRPKRDDDVFYIGPE